jgi:3-deoxy-D-manno-octulosonate 8-phosphate phosphatase (KDO 8-P phosphatase)
MRAANRARRLKLMAFDVDGVLTDGTLYFTPGGEEMKAFSTQDGQGMKLLQSAGVRVALITARRSQAVELRARNLGIELVRQGADDKLAAMQDVLAGFGLSLAEAGYMGDDVMDLPLLRACAFSATVADGHELVRRRVDYVSRAAAGRGAVREVCEFILRAQGALDAALAPYID